MPIVVSCDCGKKFKAKDAMAGKRVRCPGCQEPVRIPDGSPAAAGNATAKQAKASPGSPAVDADDAILRFEEAQKKKAEDAETEAALQEERTKLIESYDQLTGRGAQKDLDNKKKKTELLESGKPKKATAATKVADAGGAFFSNMLVKYVIIAALLAGGAYGSVQLVKFVTGYMSTETSAQVPKQDQIKQLYVDFDRAFAAKQYSEANDILKKIISLDPSKEMNRNYTSRLKKLNDAN